MPQQQFDRDISPDEQLREVSRILLEALFRVRRDGPPPRPTAPPPLHPNQPGDARPRPRRSLPKLRHAKQKPGTYANRLKNLFKKRKPQSVRFWLDRVVSIHGVPFDELARAVCYTPQATRDLEIREAFDFALGQLSSDERRVARLVTEHDITNAAREMGISWRQVAKALMSMRAMFEKAGFDAVSHVQCV